jgi:phospholipid-binding lipoprotein MlaA
MQGGWPLCFLLLLLTGCGSLAADKVVENHLNSPMLAEGTEAENPVVPEEEGPTAEKPKSGEENGFEARQGAETDLLTGEAEEDFTGAGEAEEDFTGEDIFDEEVQIVDVNDPIEPFNRAMFWVNDKLYFYLFKPVARGLRVVPEPARQSVSNFFSNIGTPVRFANSLLQLKFADAGSELGRLVINSTLGIGGLFDPAKAWFDLHRKDEDFGQTLGNYGVGNGFYVVWPVFGPSTARDSVGMAADYFLDPLAYVDMKFLERVGLESVDKETNLSLDKDTYEAIKRQALDPYLYLRTSYAQHRKGKVEK